MQLAETDARIIINAVQEIVARNCDFIRDSVKQSEELLPKWLGVKQSWKSGVLGSVYYRLYLGPLMVRLLTAYGMIFEGQIWIAAGNRNRGIGTLQRGLDEMFTTLADLCLALPKASLATIKLGASPDPEGMDRFTEINRATVADASNAVRTGNLREFLAMGIDREIGKYPFIGVKDILDIFARAKKDVEESILSDNWGNLVDPHTDPDVGPRGSSISGLDDSGIAAERPLQNAEQILRELMSRVGIDIVKDASRLEVEIRRLAGLGKREANLLILGLREGAPSTILASSDEPAKRVEENQLSEWLMEDYGLSKDEVLWLIGAWTGALRALKSPVPGDGVLTTHECIEGSSIQIYNSSGGVPSRIEISAPETPLYNSSSNSVPIPAGLPAILSSREQADTLRVVKVDGRWGFISEDGKIAIEPQFDEAFPFSEGYARVKTGGKYGFIECSGRLAIDAVFEEAKSFSQGLAAVGLGRREHIDYGGQRSFVADRWGFVDGEGRVLIPPAFLDACSFACDRACVCVSGEEMGRRWNGDPACKYAIIDKSGKVVTASRFDLLWGYKEGLAPALTGAEWQQNEEQPTLYREGGNWGYVDASGSFKIDPGFEDVGEFQEGLAHTRRIKGDPWMFIDCQGNVIIRLAYVGYGFRLAGFSEGLCGVPLDEDCKSYFYIDAEGSTIIPYVLGRAQEFHEGMAGFEIEGKHGYINRKGEIVILPKFDCCGDFRRGIAMVWQGESIGYIDQCGEYIWKPRQ